MSTPPPSQNAALIARLVSLVQQGQWELAENLLHRLLSQQPREPDGLQLLGLVRAHQGRTPEAESLYRRSLALRPRQPNVQINLSLLLLGTGRAEEAIALLRAAVRADPNNADLFLALGQLQHGAGDAEFAERNLRAVLRLRPNDPSAVLSLSGILNLSDRAQDSEALLRQALAQEITPGMRAALEHNLAVSLKVQRRYAEALPLFDAALKRAPGLPLAEANRASTLQHLDRQEEAIAGFRAALRRDPQHMAAHQELNALLYRMGRDEDFLRSFDDALRLAPDKPELLIAKGGFLNRTGRHQEAADVFARAVRAAPQSPAAQDGLALALAGLDRLDDAIAAYETSLRLRPDEVPTQINLAGLLLRNGDAARALELTQGALAKEPFDQAALAVHELALRLNGDARADALADYEKHVQVFDLDPPDGFADMADFNAALNAYLDTLHGDAREHFDQTLRLGTQTMDPLFDGGNVLIAALRRRIDDAVQAYIVRMEDGSGHPLASRRTNRGHRYTGSWSSRLRDRGFHTNHIHPAGWISSCYYVAVPPESADATAQQGWIKFGEPSFATGLATAVRRTVQPVPGRLVLFPSYMWHGTVPFHSASARTTIAFDAVPS